MLKSSPYKIPTYFLHVSSFCFQYSIRYDTYIGFSSRMSPLLSWQGLDQPSYLQTSSQLYSSSWPRHISCLAVTLLISLRRFLLPLAVDFVSLTNKGLSVLEIHIVPRSTLNVLLNLEKNCSKEKRLLINFENLLDMALFETNRASTRSTSISILGKSTTILDEILIFISST